MADLLIFRVANGLAPAFALIVTGFSYARRYSADMRVVEVLNLQVFVPAFVFDSPTRRSLF